MNLSRVFGCAAAVCVWLLPVSSSDAQPTSAPTSQPTSAPAVSTERIADLVAQLGDESVTKREQASRELAKVGLPAVSALRVAVQGDDPEIAGRAKLLLKSIPWAAIDSGACIRWKIPLPAGKHWGLVVTKDVAIFYGGDKKLHAVSLADGKPVWETALDWNEPLLVLRGDRLICHQQLGKITPLLVLNAATGERIWQRDNVGRAVAGDDRILCSMNGNLCVLALKDGSAIWERPRSELFDGTAFSMLHYTPEACVLQVHYRSDQPDNPSGTKLLALNSATGDKLWDMDVSGSRFASGYKHSDVRDGKLYVLWDTDKKPCTRVKVIDLASGRELSELPLIAPRIDNAIQVTETYVFHGAAWFLFVCNREDGKLVWRYGGSAIREGHPLDWALRRGFGGRSSGLTSTDWRMMEHQGALVFSVGDGVLGIDLKTGKPLWKFPSDGFITWGPVVRDGVACFMDDSDMDRAEGTVGFMSGYTLQPRNDGSKTAVDPADRKRFLYALDLSNAGLLGLPENPVEWEDPWDRRVNRGDGDGE